MGHQSIASPPSFEDLLVPNMSGTHVTPSRCSLIEDLQVRIKCRKAMIPIQLKAERSRCVPEGTQCTKIYRTYLLQDAYEYIVYRLEMKILKR
jgi:site-specific recombinase XerD